MRVLICGSRHWTDQAMVTRVLRAMKHRVALVIEGGATGADTCGKLAAMELDLPYSEFQADWKQYGTRAGPIRNSEMLVKAKPTLVLAFHEDPELGSGTKDMVRKALTVGIPVRIFPAKKK